MFRVYDNKTNKWDNHNIYLNADGELFRIKRAMFDWVRVPLALDAERYVYHKSIELIDKNGKEVFEGDYLKAQVADDRAVIGLVCYAHELSAYVILCVDSDEFYTLGSEVSEDIEVVGNVFDGYHN